MQYGKTKPKTERRIMAVFWSIAAVFGLLMIFHLKSVHVESVNRIDEKDGAVLYIIDVVNPTRDPVLATLCLTTGNAANDGAVPAASVTHKRLCQVPANDRVSTEIRFEASQARFLGRVHSAKVCDIDVRH